MTFLIATSVLFGPIKSVVVKISHFTFYNPNLILKLASCKLSNDWTDDTERAHGTWSVCGDWHCVWGLRMD